MLAVPDLVSNCSLQFGSSALVPSSARVKAMASASAAEQFEVKFGIPKRLPESAKDALPRKKFRKVKETYANFVKDLTRAPRSGDGNPWGLGEEALRAEPELGVLADLPLYPPEEMVRGLSVEQACKVHARFYMILNRLLKDSRIERDRCIKEEEAEEAGPEPMPKRPRVAPPSPPLALVPAPAEEETGDESGSDSSSDTDSDPGPDPADSDAEDPAPEDSQLPDPVPAEPDAAELDAAPAAEPEAAEPGLPQVAPAAPERLTPMQWKEKFLTPVAWGEPGVRASALSPVIKDYFGVVLYDVKVKLQEMECQAKNHKVNGVTRGDIFDNGRQCFLKLKDVDRA